MPDETVVTPTIEEQVKQANGLSGEPPKLTPDEYIAKRTEARREKRGGVQVRIDKANKEAAEARREADAAKKEAEEAKKLAEEAKTKPAEVSTPVAEPDKPDPRPKREDFQEEAAHTQAIAEWVVRQQNKIIAKVPEKAADTNGKREISFDANNPEHVKLKTEFDGFMASGQAFSKNNPDFTERLNTAAAKGLTLDNQAQRAIMRLNAPEVLYFLADPKNEHIARGLMSMDGLSQVMEVGKIADRLKVKPSDYVSSAPAPGQVLTNGSTRATIPRDKMDTDDYIKMRREEKRGKFRH